MSAIRTDAENSDYVAKKLKHLNRNDRLGPPVERTPDELDRVIEGVIEALPAANRLYPDLYAWVIADAVREHLAQQTTTPEEGRCP